MKKTILIFFTAIVLISPAAFSQNQPVGINMHALVDYSPALPFVDMMKMARAWSANESDEPLDLDSLGNVRSLAEGQSAVTYMMTAEISWPAGTWVFMYEGTGTFEFLGSPTITSSEPGRIEMTIGPDNILILILSDVDPNDYPRNLRLILPGFEDTYQAQPFHPDFLVEVGQFNTLRFMDWQFMNGILDGTAWENRTTPAHFTQSRFGYGVAFEHLVQLVNTIDRNPWVTVPHNADDDYVRDMAIFLRDGVEPGRKIYIEYSNEIWNQHFRQTQYAQEMGLALGLSENGFEATLRYYSQRSVEIFDIFTDVFGDNDRLVRVAASQGGNTWIAETVLEWQSAKDKIDAYAVAPYFGGNRGYDDVVEEVVTWSVDQLLDSLEADMDSVLNEQQAVADYLAQENIEFLTYEAGQHLVGVGAAQENQDLTDLFIAANRHPRMYDIYIDYMTEWNNISNDLMVIFSLCTTPSKFGAWGLREFHDQPLENAPKLRAALDYMNGTDTSVSKNPPADSFDLIAWPNPVSTTLNLEVEVAFLAQNVIIEMVNLLGQKFDVILDKLGTNLSVDVSELPNGIYFYKVSSAGGNQQTGKVVVLH